MQSNLQTYLQSYKVSYELYKFTNLKTYDNLLNCQLLC